MSGLTLRRVATASGRAIGAVFVIGCGHRLDDAECRRLLDHYTERLVLEESPRTSAERVAEAQIAARVVAEKDPRFHFGECSRKVSRRSYECAMQAPSVDAIERCLVF